MLNAGYCPPLQDTWESGKCRLPPQAHLPFDQMTVSSFPTCNIGIKPVFVVVKITKTTYTKALIKCLTHKGHSTNVRLPPSSPFLLPLSPSC